MSHRINISQNTREYSFSKILKVIMQFAKFNYQTATSHFVRTILLSVFNLKKAIPNVKGSSLPKNIVTVKMILVAVDNVDVIPRLKPTVPRAEAV